MTPMLPVFREYVEFMDAVVKAEKLFLEGNVHPSELSDIEKILSSYPDAELMARGTSNYGARLDAVREQLKKASERNKMDITLDEIAADNGSNKTQDQWTAYFNDKNEIMASMPDLYMAGKSNNQNLLESLRKDFQESWIVTSTRIKYEDKTNARIIHDYGSRLIAPVEHKIIIPESGSGNLAKVLGTSEGLIYAQTLFGTNDNASQIKDTLQKLSNYSLDKIKVWFAALLARPVERAACLDYVDGDFRVGGYDDLGGSGRSRGVRRAKNFP